MKVLGKDRLMHSSLGSSLQISADIQDHGANPWPRQRWILLASDFNMILKDQNPSEVTVYQCAYIVYWKAVGWWFAADLYGYTGWIELYIFSIFGSLETKVICLFFAGSWYENKPCPVFLRKVLGVVHACPGLPWYLPVHSSSHCIVSLIFIEALHGFSWVLSIIWSHIIDTRVHVCEL